MSAVLAFVRHSRFPLIVIRRVCQCLAADLVPLAFMAFRASLDRLDPRAYDNTDDKQDRTANHDGLQDEPSEPSLLLFIVVTAAVGYAPYRQQFLRRLSVGTYVVDG